MKTKSNKSKAMDLFATRLPKSYGRLIKRLARKEKKTVADLLRTAWTEYVLVHNLEG